MLALRNSKPAEQLDALSVQIASNLIELPEFKEARIVSAYVHIGSEVRTRAIVLWALANGKRVIVPLTDRINRRLLFSEIRNPGRELQSGTFGIPEPRPKFRRPVALAQADVILVPGVAWDLRGYRIGYGGGYYDRSINHLSRDVPRIGLAYEFQIVNDVPRTSHDRRVDKIVTERRTIDTAVADRTGN
jgi:5-formyltetrahydrofolate cyclo-ligase